MDRYKPSGRKIFSGIFLLFLAGFVLWFIAEGFLIYTPFADRLAFRDIGGYYIEGRVIRLLTSFPDENGGGVSMIEAEYQVGFQRVQSHLPAHLFYYDGLEVGDSIAIPYSHKNFGDMSGDDKIVLSVSVTVLTIFLIWSIFLFSREISAYRYFRKLILNKTYVYAQLEKSEYSGKRARAVCSYCNHRFISRWYLKERYPFQRGGEVKVYVDLLKDSNKYLISDT